MLSGRVISVAYRVGHAGDDIEQCGKEYGEVSKYNLLEINIGKIATSQGSSKFLDITDHSRDIVGLTYVYPVVSRRAGGVSVGINLNPNSACNWRCIYCQVPELKRGSAPTIDLTRLEKELSNFCLLYTSPSPRD